jgi:hypothetical protein
MVRRSGAAGLNRGVASANFAKKSNAKFAAGRVSAIASGRPFGDRAVRATNAPIAAASRLAR